MLILVLGSGQATRVYYRVKCGMRYFTKIPGVYFKMTNKSEITTIIHIGAYTISIVSYEQILKA